MAKRATRRSSKRGAGRPGGEAAATLRIGGGELRGSRLSTPPGKLLRPMRAQVRLALFNILGAERVAGATVLDLFAGSGSLGLEALSRGAARGVFVEREPRCLAVLKRNLAHLRVEDRALALRHDLRAGVRALRDRGPFSLVLVHPPFELLRSPEPELDVAVLLHEVATRPGLLGDDPRIAFETPRACYRDPEALPGLEVLLRREYGSTALFVTRPATPPPAPPAAPTSPASPRG